MIRRLALAALLALLPSLAAAQVNSPNFSVAAYVKYVLSGNITIGGNLTVGGSIIDNTNGISLNNPTGGLKGAGTINLAGDYYKNGTIIPETVSLPLTLTAGNVACPACVLISGTGHGDSNYSILSTDRYVFINAAFTLPRVWTLPAANSLAVGTTIWVQDALNTITTANTLTVQRAGADTINGSFTSVVITGNSGGLTFTTDGVSNWGAPEQTVTTGGTGQGTLTNHGVLVGAGINPVTQLAVGANGTVLLGQTAADPAFNAMSGDVTITNAGVTAIGANRVTRAMEAQGVARSVIGVTGNATANVADIQGTANQALVVNSGGTALAFGAVNLASASAVTGTLPIANGGTNDTGTAWASYTPTVTCGGGPPTTFSVTGSSSKSIGKTVFITINLVITTIGPCVTPLTFSLPVAPLTNSILVGSENQSTGKIVKIPLNAGSTTTGGLTNYDNTFAPASSTTFILTGVYQSN